MKTPLILALLSTVCLADPVPVATPVPRATPFRLPSQIQRTPEQVAADKAEADKKTNEIMEAVRKRREAEALERIARALEERR